MKFTGNIGDLAGGVAPSMMKLGIVGDAANRFEMVAQYLYPGELFSAEERAEIRSAFSEVRRLYKPTGKTTAAYDAAVLAANQWVAEIARRVVPYSKQLARGSNAAEVKRGKRMYRAWIPRDNDLKDFAVKAAIVVGVGYALGPFTAGATSGTAATGIASGSALPGAGAAAIGAPVIPGASFAAGGATLLPEIVVTGGAISTGAAAAAAAGAIAAASLPGALAAPSLPPPFTPQGATLLPEISVTAAPVAGAPAAIGAAAIPGSVPWLTENVFATNFTEPTVTQTFSDKALEILKKEAIDRGIDYAMELAAQWYAEKLQAKMAAQMQRDLEAQLLAAQAEYEKLLRQGATPEQATSQASRSNGKFGVLLALAGIAALLLLRR